MRDKAGVFHVPKQTRQQKGLDSFKAAFKLKKRQIETLIQVLTAQKKPTVGETGKITYQ